LELAYLARVVVPDFAQARDVLPVYLIQSRIVSGGFVAEIDGPVMTLGGRAIDTTAVSTTVRSGKGIALL
jgi:hypothetical protein